MTYSLVLYEADGASDSQRREAEQRFRTVLEETLGDASLVAPVLSLLIMGSWGRCESAIHSAGEERQHGLRILMPAIACTHTPAHPQVAAQRWGRACGRRRQASLDLKKATVRAQACCAAAAS